MLITIFIIISLQTVANVGHYSDKEAYTVRYELSTKLPLPSTRFHLKFSILILPLRCLFLLMLDLPPCSLFLLMLDLPPRCPFLLMLDLPPHHVRPCAMFHARLLPHPRLLLYRKLLSFTQQCANPILPQILSSLRLLLLKRTWKPIAKISKTMLNM